MIIQVRLKLGIWKKDEQTGNTDYMIKYKNMRVNTLKLEREIYIDYLDTRIDTILEKEGHDFNNCYDLWIQYGNKKYQTFEELQEV